MAIEIKSFNQILGGMVRKIIAETPLSDINPGSVFLSLLEACASQDFDNNVAILNILELLNVDAIRNNDLDNKAADLGLERYAAKEATGTVKILNTNITKQSSGLYSLKPAPISGQTVLFVNDTEGWDASGDVYIGRGTNSFEGPISYTSITEFSTYSQINLSAALQKDHLASETVINAQGQPDRVINAGTTVKIPANNQNPDIVYNTIRDVVLPAGEDEVDGVLVVAQVAGTQSNALINTIRQFDAAPFIGAAVTNTVAFTTGTDVETDVQLRNRIKAYAASLARGTSPAILSAVLGLSDPDENKRVASAILSQSLSVGAPSILYIDDGSGFQPSQAGQTLDVLVARANGSEEFLQLANYPLCRAQVINGAVGPFVFLDQMFLRVAVDGVEETVIFTTDDFANISVATLSEIVAAINAKATLFKARLTEDSQRILIYTEDPDAELIQVAPIRSTDTEALYANNLLNFPIKEVSYIALFQNSTRLHQRERVATVETLPFAVWNLFVPGDLLISVDGTPAQDQSFSLADFPGVSSFTVLTLEDWVDAFNAKFAGITASVTPNQTMQISSNKRGTGASLDVVGGTYLAQLFGSNEVSVTGQDSQFEINRSTGNIRLLTEIAEGDIITAGIADAKGFVVSETTTSGAYNLDVDDSGRQAQMVVVADSSVCDKLVVNLTLDSPLVITDEGSSVMRLMANNVTAFRNIQPGHFIYIAYRDPDVSPGWVSAENSGLFKVKARGPHLEASVDTYIEVWNNNTVAETVTVAEITDFAAFHTDGYPQLWTSSYLDLPTDASLDDLTASINTALIGVKASIFRTNSVKITSATEDAGSIAVPVVSGNMSAVFEATEEVQLNNSPLIANKTSTKDMLGFLKMRPITSQNSYLSRSQYPAVNSELAVATDADVYPFADTYSEVITGPTSPVTKLSDAEVELSDQLLFPRINNEGLLRSIKAKPTNASVGTQQGLPRTLFPHTTSDQVQVFQSLQMAQDDNIVVVMDQDATIKTINIPAARTGQINSGSDSLTFIPTSTELSANDIDNEPGVDFSTVNVWGTDLNGTNFADYSILFRAHNWYASGGTGSSNGKFIIRSAEYGANGNKQRFSIEYPTLPNQDESTTFTNTPSWNKLSYVFGSGSARATGILAGTTVYVTGPYSNASQNFPSGPYDSGDYWDFAFNDVDFSAVQVNDVISSFSGCGFPINFLGQYGVKAVNGEVFFIDYNTQTASFTVGQTLTGTDSLATATITNDTDLGTTGTLTITPISGDFIEGEEITDGLGGTAIIDTLWTGSVIRLYIPDASAQTLTISNPGLVYVFPLTKHTVDDIVATVNDSNILVAAKVGLGTADILVSTREDQYTYSTDATALAHLHNPGDPDQQDFVALFDGTAEVQSFSNDNPNFTLKAPLVIPATGVSASVYRMDTALNEDDTQGEYFKLVPTTVKNVQHHLTQKALSQLPIVADVSISDIGKRVQIVSKQFGGSGAIEILGGQANSAQTDIIGQSVVASDSSGSYLLATVAAFPNTYAVGDTVKITNRHGVARKTQWASTSTVEVKAFTSNRAEYYWDPIITQFEAGTTFTITDVSSSYSDYDGVPLASGMIWRWEHSIDNAETLTLVQPGHQVIAFGCPNWDSTNMAKVPGEGSTVGLPIIAVDDVNHTFDVVNPFGRAMSATEIGTGTVNICPAPRLKWTIAHGAPAPISSISRASNVVTVETTTPHFSNTGDNVNIYDSLGALADGNYGPITVVDAQTFTFSDAGDDVVELNVGATVAAGGDQTAYRLEKLGANNLIKISWANGAHPRFADCGVAVDDYCIIQGSTFNASNNGTHRVVAVENDSVILEHEGAVQDRNLLVHFNTNNIPVDWAANSNIVTGDAGSFKYLSDGVWVKKVEDDDARYLQVTGCDTNDYLTATKIFLGDGYGGVTGTALGISYDMVFSPDKGVLLQSVDDLVFYEGDSAFKTDTLFVQALSNNSNWFTPNNSGSFEITEIGNETSTRRPYVRVTNASASNQTGRALSAAPTGLYIVENDQYKYTTYRTVANSTISDTNNLQRSIYLLPDARDYKISESNNSVMSHVGKMGYDLITSVGTDGYTFYTGLLRRAQRTIDGFSPDPSTFTERRAVGSRIEILPPLIKNIAVVITVTTKEGSTIQDISSNIKSAIIDYVDGLGVGEDVILSAIIAAVMKVKGVAAATFNVPLPSEERIKVSANEKALIFADAIGIV